jgi:pyridoxal phosphate enzyme (YggS family)
MTDNTLIDANSVRKVEDNLGQIRNRIAKAAQEAGRDPDGVTLIAVTKTRPMELVKAAYLAGIRNFGENRVEEGGPKATDFCHWLEEKADGGDPPKWHMIGHIQHRKVGDVLEHFDVVHSLDSVRLAERLNRLAEAEEKRLPVFLECNVSGETNKYGFALAGWRENKQVRCDFFQAVTEVARLPRLRIWGLMTMAPLVNDAELARPVFHSLRELRDTLNEEFPSIDWHHLSMGMTDDFEVAVEEGATMVRIGRAIFDMAK